MGTGLRTLALCLSDVSLCFICQSAIRGSLCSASEQFMNFYSARRHLGCISQGTGLIFKAASPPLPKKKKKKKENMIGYVWRQQNVYY